MLKHVPTFMDAELLWILAAMGHGDELAVVDRNFPALSVAKATASGKLVTLGGLNAPTTIGGILELMPLDSFVDAPLAWMDPVDQPGAILSVHAEVLHTCQQAGAVPGQRHLFSEQVPGRWHRWQVWPCRGAAADGGR